MPISDYVSPPGLLSGAIGQGIQYRLSRDRMAQEESLARKRFEEERQMREERRRMFEAQQAQAAGEDVVTGPQGVDWAATEKARRARIEADAMAAARGTESVFAPTMRRPQVSPEMTAAMDATGEFAPAIPVEPDPDMLRNPAFVSARAKAVQRQAEQDAVAERQVAGAQAAFERGMALSRVRGDQSKEAARSRVLAKNIGAMEIGDIMDAYGVDEETASKMKSNSGSTPTAGSGQWKANQADQFIKDVEGSLPASRKLSDSERSGLRAKYMSGTASVNAPSDVLKSVNSEDIAAQMLDEVSEGIAAFNKKYGKKAFDEYVGPIDSPVFKGLSRVIPPSERSAADRDARAIHRRAAGIVQNYRNKQFGTALTGSETEAFREIVADPSFADYTDALGTFGEQMKSAVRKRLKNYELAPNIPAPIKERFLYDAKTEEAQNPTPLQTLTPRQQRIQELRAKLGK